MTDKDLLARIARLSVDNLVDNEIAGWILDNEHDQKSAYIDVLKRSHVAKIALKLAFRAGAAYALREKETGTG